MCGGIRQPAGLPTQSSCLGLQQIEPIIGRNNRIMQAEYDVCIVLQRNLRRDIASLHGGVIFGPARALHGHDTPTKWGGTRVILGHRAIDHEHGMLPWYFGLDPNHHP